MSQIDTESLESDTEETSTRKHDRKAKDVASDGDDCTINANGKRVHKKSHSDQAKKKRRLLDGSSKKVDIDKKLKKLKKLKKKEEERARFKELTKTILLAMQQKQDTSLTKKPKKPKKKEKEKKGKEKKKKKEKSHDDKKSDQSIVVEKVKKKKKKKAKKAKKVDDEALKEESSSVEETPTAEVSESTTAKSGNDSEHKFPKASWKPQFASITSKDGQREVETRFCHCPCFLTTKKLAVDAIKAIGWVTRSAEASADSSVVIFDIDPPFGGIRITDTTEEIFYATKKCCLQVVKYLHDQRRRGVLLVYFNLHFMKNMFHLITALRKYGASSNFAFITHHKVCYPLLIVCVGSNLPLASLVFHYSSIKGEELPRGFKANSKTPLGWTKPPSVSYEFARHAFGSCFPGIKFQHAYVVSLYSGSASFLGVCKMEQCNVYSCLSFDQNDSDSVTSLIPLRLQVVFSSSSFEYTLNPGYWNVLKLGYKSRDVDILKSSAKEDVSCITMDKDFMTFAKRDEMVFSSTTTYDSVLHQVIDCENAVMHFSGTNMASAKAIAYWAFHQPVSVVETLVGNVKGRPIYWPLAAALANCRLVDWVLKNWGKKSARAIDRMQLVFNGMQIVPIYHPEHVVYLWSLIQWIEENKKASSLDDKFRLDCIALISGPILKLFGE